MPVLCLPSYFPPFSFASLLDEMHKQVNTTCLKNPNNSAGNVVKDREAVISSLILHPQNLLLSNGKQHFRLKLFLNSFIAAFINAVKYINF